MSLALLAPTAFARADAQPYGTNDAGGFRNVLPPGEAGVANAFQLGAVRGERRAARRTGPTRSRSTTGCSTRRRR